MTSFILLLEEIKKDHQRILKLSPYEDQYNWNELEFPLAIQKKGKFERNNPVIAVNVLFNKKERIYTACWSELNRNDWAYWCVKNGTWGSRKMSHLPQRVQWPREVRDHCQYTDLYRWTAHNNCNLKYLIPDHISIVSHNLRGYEAHLFIRELGKKFNENDIGVSNEDCKEVGKNIQLRFIDSYRFLASSLDKLASNLMMIGVSTLGSFTRKRKFLGLWDARVYTDTIIWMAGKNLKRLLKIWSLPLKNAFYSKVNTKGISDQDHEHDSRFGISWRKRP